MPHEATSPAPHLFPARGSFLCLGWGLSRGRWGSWQPQAHTALMGAGEVSPEVGSVLLSFFLVPGIELRILHF